MYENNQFELIAKALQSTRKSLEEHTDYHSNAIVELGQAKEEMIKALSYATSIDHQLIIGTLFDQE
jgi:hypothetical protein